MLCGSACKWYGMTINQPDTDSDTDLQCVCKHCGVFNKSLRFRLAFYRESVIQTYGRVLRKDEGSAKSKTAVTLSIPRSWHCDANIFQNALVSRFSVVSAVVIQRPIDPVSQRYKAHVRQNILHHSSCKVARAPMTYSSTIGPRRSHDQEGPILLLINISNAHAQLCRMKDALSDTSLRDPVGDYQILYRDASALS